MLRQVAPARQAGAPPREAGSSVQRTSLLSVTHARASDAAPGSRRRWGASGAPGDVATTPEKHQPLPSYPPEKTQTQRAPSSPPSVVPSTPPVRACHWPPTNTHL